MSNARQETVADIVAEMRKEAFDRSDDASCTIECAILRHYSDRIEAASKREREAGAEAAQICGEIGEMVGIEAACNQPVTDCHGLNAAEMREALNDAYSCAILNLLKTQNVEYVEIANALDKAKAVLAKQQRNCDRPECATTKEAQDTWRKEDGGQTAYYEWLFAEAKGYEKMSEKAGGIE